jgi:hypothetical protein
MSSSASVITLTDLSHRCRVSMFLRTFIYWGWLIYLRESAMDTFWTIVIILVILWAVGFFALPGVGALIHLLLVIAVIVIVYRLLTGRHILSGEKR